MLAWFRRFYGREGNQAGILMILFGILLFTMNDALAKWLVRDFPVVQLLLMRSAVSLLILGPAILKRGFLQVVRVERPLLHILRVALVVAEVAAFYAAVRYLPLADALTIYMACPIFMTVLSVPFLGEKVGPRRWAAVALGFLGVVLVLQPGAALVSWPAVVALLGSFFFALMLLVTRRLRTSEGLTLITWQTLAVFIVGLLGTPFYWVTPAPPDLLLLGTLGCLSTVAHLFFNRALQVAPAAVVAPFQYTQIIWAVILGFLVFGDVPGVEVMMGASLIVGSGLYIFYREQRLARRPLAAELPKR